MSGIDKLRTELLAKNYKFLRPGVELAPCNAKTMKLTDPFGNRLRLNEDLPKPA